MKILSWNVNGLRAVYRKNLLSWIKKSKADIYCFQEIKAHEQDIPEKIKNLKGFYCSYNLATKKGYSGVAVYTKEKPQAISKKLGHKRFDQEGRFLRLDYKRFTLINIYLPQGDRTKKNIPYKLKVYQKLIAYLKKIKNRRLIIIGDFNIAHTELDLARPQNNRKNTMFTPEERQQITNLLNLGLIDTFRHFQQQGQNYTWWPYYYQARQRNIGWRLDYCFISKNLLTNLNKAYILKNVMGSDHCPIGIDLK